MKLIIEYEQIAPDKLPQDPSSTGERWTFALEEHDEITFPHAIKATDAEGRSYTYLAVGPDWREVRITKIERQTLTRASQVSEVIKGPTNQYGERLEGPVSMS